MSESFMCIDLSYLHIDFLWAVYVIASMSLLNNSN
jgi:hypothetical protein